MVVKMDYIHVNCKVLLYCAWTVMLLNFVSVKSEIRVEVSTPINPIVVDGIIPFQCQIWGIEDDHSVAIGRRIGEKFQRISVDDNIMKSPDSSRMFLAIRTLAGGVRVYFLTILDASSLDRGQYLCTITKMSQEGTVNDIARDSINIAIRYYPEKGNPSCAINPNNLVYEERDTFELTCSSENGSPPVQLKWSRLGYTDNFRPINSSTGNQVHSRAVITAYAEYQSTIFVCEMTSQAFPDYKRSCTIGPIVIRQFNDLVDSNHVIPTQRPKVAQENTVKKENAINDCTESCKHSSPTVLYLTAATVSTSLLGMIFLITTIIMCCKYCNKSAQIRQHHEYIPTPPIRFDDPSYRSLPKRSGNELVYMTLEDPNNPEGKVLLPKEVFDEFYNKTLTLRKT